MYFNGSEPEGLYHYTADNQKGAKDIQSQLQ